MEEPRCLVCFPKLDILEYTVFHCLKHFYLLLQCCFCSERPMKRLVATNAAWSNTLHQLISVLSLNWITHIKDYAKKHCTCRKTKKNTNIFRTLTGLDTQNRSPTPLFKPVYHIVIHFLIAGFSIHLCKKLKPDTEAFCPLLYWLVGLVDISR